MPSLFEAARAGNKTAEAEIHRLVRLFARVVCRGGGPRGALDADWEDVAQEASAKFFATGLGQYRGTGSPESFLYSVVRATAIQMSRSTRRRQQREESSSLQSFRPTVTNPAARVEVDQVLSRLTGPCRDIIERVFLDGASYRDLARDLGIAESSVRSRLSRCVREARLAAFREKAR